MTATDPQFIYLALILPGVFGLTIVGEGVAKVLHADVTGWVVLLGGLLFMSVVGVGFLYLLGL